jgi:hypothetical protein
MQKATQVKTKQVKITQKHTADKENDTFIIYSRI